MVMITAIKITDIPVFAIFLLFTTYCELRGNKKNLFREMILMAREMKERCEE